mmetsp:Transcript_874/g.3192  ORF Transcript_874/g.3192 Transcript_874/m.3192 type:complete len:441 (-) Transcript_874:158-1480(-)
MVVEKRARRGGGGVFLSQVLLLICGLGVGFMAGRASSPSLLVSKCLGMSTPAASASVSTSSSMSSSVVTSAGGDCTEQVQAKEGECRSLLDNLRSTLEASCDVRLHAASDALTAARAESSSGSASPTHPLPPKVTPLESGGDENLREVLERVAINGEVMIAVSNSNLITRDGSYGMLRTFIDCVKRAQVSNFLVVAMDDDTAAAMRALGVAYWQRGAIQLMVNARDNHGTSSQKFHILREFLVLGYSVLLSDVDVVTLQNPFTTPGVLYRDSDVEGLSDGFDAGTAYGKIEGIDDPKMGWSRYAQKFELFALNSGLFYLRSTPSALALVDAINEHLKKNKAWDQTVYNEKIHMPSHGHYKSPQASLRVMDIHAIMNSKTLFRFTRHNKGLMARNQPAMIHVNYHPDKWERMRAIMQYYFDGDKRALDKFPDGSCWQAPNC